MTSDVFLTGNEEITDSSTALNLLLQDVVQVLVNGNEIHLTTFEDEGRGPFRYEVASIEALKTAVGALPVEGSLGQLTLFKCLDGDQHGLYELYNWLADYSEQKGFLYTRAMLQEAFSDYRDLSITEEEREMHEGSSHRGMSAVISLTARNARQNRLTGLSCCNKHTGLN